MSEGTIKFFDDAKGWGFITGDDGGPDIFVHYKNIDMPGFKSLTEGDRVCFELVHTDKGRQAHAVRRLDSTPTDTSTPTPAVDPPTDAPANTETNANAETGTTTTNTDTQAQA